MNPTSPLRILFTTAWFPNRKVAGDGVFIEKHAAAIAALHDVAVLMVQTDEAVRPFHIDLETRTLTPHHGGHVVLIYVPKTHREVPLFTGLVRLFWLMAGYLKGYRYIRQRYWQGQRPDLCHVNVLTRAAGLPFLLHRFHHIPYLITEHWSRYRLVGAYPSSRLQLACGRRFVKEAAFVCPVSLNLEEAMKQWGLHNTHYVRIGNVVDTEVFRLVAHPSLPAVVSFVHVSWMRDNAKNISGILRVCQRLLQAGFTFHFDFIGEGNDKATLEAYSHSLGLDTCVTFCPASTGVALAETLSRHHALVMFSNYENQPVSILEALSCGLPVIATAVGAIPAMLASRRGLTVATADEAALYEALCSFITLAAAPFTAETQALRTARHEYIARQYSPIVVARQYDSLYQAALHP